MSTRKPGDRYLEWLNVADHGDQMFTASREAYEANGRGFWVTSDEEQVKALGKSEAMYYAAARMPDLLRHFVDDGLVGAGDPASGTSRRWSIPTIRPRSLKLSVAKGRPAIRAHRDGTRGGGMSCRSWPIMARASRERPQPLGHWNLGYFPRKNS